VSALIVKPPIFRYKPAEAVQPTLFLAGSIEQGKAENWQAILTERVKNSYSMIYNPRRDGWDASWPQTIDDPNFNPQVNWELDMIDYADVIAFYFDPNTQSPITLAELGRVSALKPEVAHVCCPEGYFRKGNVDIMCERYHMRSYKSLKELADGLVASATEFEASYAEG
jgi:hypothetical protein